MHAHSFLVAIALAGLSNAAPAQPDTSTCPADNITPACCPDCFGKLPDAYTLTTVKFKDDGCPDPVYDALKVESWYVFEEEIIAYCPWTGAQAASCPQGKDMALAGSLYPLSMVPGGQDTFVDVDGAIKITTQHTHSIPSGAYPSYEGWIWTPYQTFPNKIVSGSHCNETNAEYYCHPPSGFFTFMAPNATVGGLAACPNESHPEATSLYAVTPGFARTDCVMLEGLGTHDYGGRGPTPPVWAYYGN